MADEIYRELQQRLDTYSVGFPKTESGIEIKILKTLLSERDAEMFLALSPKLETAESVASRLDRPSEEVAEHLEDMAERGLLFRIRRDDANKYGAIPFVHGIFEFQVKTMDREFAEMVGQYFEEAFDSAMQDAAEYFLRTVPVDQSVELPHNVASYEDALEFLKHKDKIVITDCICRKRAEMAEGDCGKPMEVCFMFGSMGQYYLDRNMGREISVEEATDILKKCQDEGLVTQPATSKNPGGMCNCCGDCCGVLRALRKHPRPATMVFSNHMATVNQEECTGCEDCLERCQMDAIVMTDGQTAEINPDRCIGCGLCVTTCPVEAIELVPKSEADWREPPSNTTEQMMSMARKRGII
jgi:Na+-translocating ferredoxin:NAD+ oxidoreductase RNF subunit RnfB